MGSIDEWEINTTRRFARDCGGCCVESVRKCVGSAVEPEVLLFKHTDTRPGPKCSFLCLKWQHLLGQSSLRVVVRSIGCQRVTTVGSDGCGSTRE